MPTLVNLGLILLFLALPAHKANAEVNLLLQCLAKEEEGFHQKKTINIYYRLNQEFVNELASSNDIKFKKKYITQICSQKVHSPSVELLKQLLLKETDLYDFSGMSENENLRTFRINYVNEFQKQVPRMFIQFISGIQSELPSAHCLEEAIPELAGFNEKVKYLENEITTKELLGQKTRLKAIFDKLAKIEHIKQNCQKQVNQQKKNKQ